MHLKKQVKLNFYDLISSSSSSSCLLYNFQSFFPSLSSFVHYLLSKCPSILAHVLMFFHSAIHHGRRSIRKFFVIQQLELTLTVVSTNQIPWSLDYYWHSFLSLPALIAYQDDDCVCVCVWVCLCISSGIWLVGWLVGPHRTILSESAKTGTGLQNTYKHTC